MAQDRLSEAADKAIQAHRSGEPGPEAIRSTGVLHPILKLQRVLGNRLVADLIQSKRLEPQGANFFLPPAVGPAVQLKSGDIGLGAVAVPEPPTAITSSQTGSGVVQRSPAPGPEPRIGGPTAQMDRHPSRTLRVTIIGHASPRWKGAATDKKADRLNEVLARQRADAVEAEIQQVVRQEMGDDVRLVVNVSRAPKGPEADIEIGSSGVGSRETLKSAKGDRRSNEEYDRRVEVEMEMATSDTRIAGKSLPSEPARSKQWRIKINKLDVLRAFVAGGAIEIEITNKLTGKQFLATAPLIGGGKPKLNPLSKEEPTGNSRLIQTDTAVEINEFEGTEISVTRADIKMGIGESMISIAFPKLMPGKGFTMYHKFGFGGPGGFHVWGNLHVFGDRSDFYDSSNVPKVFPQPLLDKYGGKHSDFINPTEETRVKISDRSTGGLVLTFPTESYDLGGSEKDRLKSFITTWTRQLDHAPVSRPTTPVSIPEPPPVFGPADRPKPVFGPIERPKPIK